MRSARKFLSLYYINRHFSRGFCKKFSKTVKYFHFLCTTTAGKWVKNRICIDKAEKKSYNEYVMKERIYVDHASTTPLDGRVVQAMLPYFTEIFGNADSPHALGRKAMQAVDLSRDRIAERIGARANEVYFTSGGTEADNWAIIGGAKAKRKAGKTRVVLSAIEHHACLSAVERLAGEGFEVVYLPVNGEGRVEIGALESAIDGNTALVCLMLANNETGVIQPVKEAVELAHSHGALCFTDGVQYAPYAPIDVQALGVDMLSLSGHKFYGPKGVGALYIRSGVKIEKLVGGGEQERGLRGGTVNVPAVVGLAEAYARTCAEMQESTRKIEGLTARFLRGLERLDGVSVNGGGEKIPSVVNLRIRGIENTAFLYAMDLAGVCLSAGSACASASVKPSHVLTAMGFSAEEAKECVRFSFGKNNTEAEIDKVVELVKATVEKLRKFRL